MSNREIVSIKHVSLAINISSPNIEIFFFSICITMIVGSPLGKQKIGHEKQVLKSIVFL